MVSMFADGQVLQPDACQSLGDRDGVIKHPPVPSEGRHCFCFGGTARIRRLFCVFFSVVFSSIHQSQRVPGKPSATVCICVTASDEVLSSSVTRPVSLFAFCQHRDCGSLTLAEATETHVCEVFQKKGSTKISVSQLLTG